MQIVTATPYRKEIIALLASENLPTVDLPENLEDFFVAIDSDEVVAVAGLEKYNQSGLLRSVAVKAKYRNQGIAKKLIKVIGELAVSNGLRELFLLTETAPDYFNRFGFTKIARTEVPAEIQLSSEFCHLCPQSAFVMKKTLERS
jgi:amino-acid N-acetyltransferase